MAGRMFGFLAYLGDRLFWSGAFVIYLALMLLYVGLWWLLSLPPTLLTVLFGANLVWSVCWSVGPINLAVFIWLGLSVVGQLFWIMLVRTQETY